MTTIYQDMGAFRFNQLESFPTLLMGVGCVFWIPVSLILGRRPVFLCCTALYTLGVIWAGVAGGFHSLLGAVCLLGFCAAPAVSTVSYVKRVKKLPDTVLIRLIGYSGGN